MRASNQVYAQQMKDDAKEKQYCIANEIERMRHPSLFGPTNSIQKNLIQGVGVSYSHHGRWRSEGAEAIERK